MVRGKEEWGLWRACSPHCILRQDQALLGLPVPEPSPRAALHGAVPWKGMGTCGEGWAGEPSVRAGRDESELQNWPWMPGDFSPHSHFKNSCWWKEICCSWLTLWLQEGLSMGVAAVCPIDPTGNGGGWSLQ